jgi:two-component system, LuxR family, sensor kinase FixL
LVTAIKEVPASHSAEALQALLDAAADGIVLIDERGIIQRFNSAAERLFGCSAHDVIGKNVAVLMPAEDAWHHDGYIAGYLKTGIPKIIGRGREVRARRLDGSVFPALLSVGVVAGSNPARFVGFIQDLTARRRAEDEAQRLQDRLWHVSRFATMGEMASGIAHELNQPLAAIANYAQACDRLLGRPDADIAEIREALREITEQAVRAGGIIRKLRALVTRSDGVLTPVSANQLILELNDLVKSMTKAQGIRYRLEFEEQLPLIEIHQDEIQQVLLNLIRNAIESYPPTRTNEPEIEVRTRHIKGGTVEISVCDNGPGVAAHMLASLFDPFRTTKDTGSGLGLAMSQTIVGRHRGTLRYQPNLPTGACFILSLPGKQA